MFRRSVFVLVLLRNTASHWLVFLWYTPAMLLDTLFGVTLTPDATVVFPR
jgi:hypothetical protein